MAIRLWTQDDLPSIQDVALATGIQTYASFIPQEDIRLHFHRNYGVKGLAQRLASAGTYGFVGEEQRAVKGFLISSYEAATGIFTVHSLYVLPAAQGKGLGVGLLDAADAVARTCGADKLWIGVITRNVQAHAWYLRHGFVFIREEPYVVGSSEVHHLIGYRMLVRNGLSAG